MPVISSDEVHGLQSKPMKLTPLIIHARFLVTKCGEVCGRSVSFPRKIGEDVRSIPIQVPWIPEADASQQY